MNQRFDDDTPKCDICLCLPPEPNSTICSECQAELDIEDERRVRIALEDFYSHLLEDIHSH